MTDHDADVHSIGATDFLREYHESLRRLLDDYEEAGGDAERAAAQRALFSALATHAQMEEDVLHGALAGIDALQAAVDESEDRHSAVKELMGEIGDLDAAEELYEAKMAALADAVRVQIEAEESDLFPQVEESDLDLEEVGQRLLKRRGAPPGTGTPGRGRKSGRTR